MNRPITVTRAALLWLLAIGAGAVETALAVTEHATEGTLGGGVWISVAVRVMIYATAALLVARFAQGRRWARWCLTGLLSVVGLAAMVVPPMTLMADGSSFLEAFATSGFLAIPFLVVRAVHIAAVVAATVLMFTASANVFFTARPEAEPHRGQQEVAVPDHRGRD